MYVLINSCAHVHVAYLCTCTCIVVYCTCTLQVCPVYSQLLTELVRRNSVSIVHVPVHKSNVNSVNSKNEKNASNASSYHKRGLCMANNPNIII